MDVKRLLLALSLSFVFIVLWGVLFPPPMNNLQTEQLPAKITETAITTINTTAGKIGYLLKYHHKKGNIISIFLELREAVLIYNLSLI